MLNSYRGGERKFDVFRPIVRTGIFLWSRAAKMEWSLHFAWKITILHSHVLGGTVTEAKSTLPANG